MGNGALYMAEEENCVYCETKQAIFYVEYELKCGAIHHDCLCKVEMTQSYFLRIDKDLVEVCPECHHYYCYGTEEQKQKYKERRNIK